MAIRLSTGIAAVLTIVAGSITLAAAAEPGRLAAFTARQVLRDEVCIAAADGRINSAERYIILTDAKQVLKPDEYAVFKRSLDRLSPPKPASAKQPVKVARKKSPPKARQSAPLPPVPIGAIQPDRVASARTVRL